MRLSFRVSCRLRARPAAVESPRRELPFVGRVLEPDHSPAFVFFGGQHIQVKHGDPLQEVAARLTDRNFVELRLAASISRAALSIRMQSG